MSCRDRAPGGRGPALLLVLLGAAGVPVGAQVDATQGLDFQAQARLDLNYRDTARLDEGGESSGTARTSADLAWLRRSPVSTLRAALRPYYEEFRADDSLSTWGGSAALGYEHRPSTTWSWSGRLTLLMAPEQDVQLPPTSDVPEDPAVQALVPRNGYVATTFGADTRIDLTPTQQLTVAVNGGARRYDRYEVDESGTTPALVDERSVGVTVAHRGAISERVGWTGRIESNWFLLDDDDPLSEDVRQQAAVLAGLDTRLTERTRLGAELGVSGITTNAGDNDVVPRLNVRWTMTGEALSWQASLLQRQGIFPGGDQSANATSGACRAAWQTGPHSNLTFGAGYGVATGAGAADASATRTTVRTLISGWSYGRGALVWSAGVNIQRQRAEGAEAIGSTLESSSFSVGAAWRLTEGRS